jgi:hypothetical protein
VLNFHLCIFLIVIANIEAQVRNFVTGEIWRKKILLELFPTTEKPDCSMNWAMEYYVTTTVLYPIALPITIKIWYGYHFEVARKWS